MQDDRKRPKAHIRHNGKWIDASFRRDGSVDYYVVSGHAGRYMSLKIAKEIAESPSTRKPYIPAQFSTERLIANRDGVDQGMRSHAARILADRELCQRGEGGIGSKS